MCQSLLVWLHRLQMRLQAAAQCTPCCDCRAGVVAAPGAGSHLTQLTGPLWPLSVPTTAAACAQMCLGVNAAAEWLAHVAAAKRLPLLLLLPPVTTRRGGTRLRVVDAHEVVTAVGYQALAAPPVQSVHHAVDAHAAKLGAQQ